MKNKKKKKILEWFVKEGALTQEENLYVAEKVFTAHSIVGWIRKNASRMKQDQIERMMKIVRLFLKDKLDLKWDGAKVEVITRASEKYNLEESIDVQTEGIK